MVEHNACSDGECSWPVDHFGAFIAWAKSYEVMGDYVPTEPDAIAEVETRLVFWPEFRDGYAFETGIEYVD